MSQKFPGLLQEPLEQLISDNLLSSHKIRLPKKNLTQAKEAIQALFDLRETADYQELLRGQISKYGLKDPGNKGIMMSYDFHVDTNGDLKLIEVNTNAAFLILGQLFYEFQKIPGPIAEFNLSALKSCIQSELLFQNKKIEKPRIAIVDHQPSSQRLYIEFLVAREIFRSWGWPCEIRDVSEAFQDRPDFIYNRYTDFFLTDPLSQTLRQAYLNKEICLSPHPLEYLLLADKHRMIEWSQGLLEKFPDLKSPIERVLLKSWVLDDTTKEEIWSRRKQLFVKPTREFGSKGSFKGSSISRKAFDELASKGAIAQEYVSAPEFAENGESFKYDLRFYAYKGEVQTIMARLYQGQTTNLRTPGGGFACVEFVN